ncbi:MAG: ribonuclease HIII [Bacilli bacterium]
MTISFKVSDNVAKKMIKYFEDKRRPKTPAYAVFQANEEDTVVTLYESGKVVFQGVSADIDANIWASVEKKLNNIDIDTSEKKKEKEVIDRSLYNFSAIGSDEVGTGDYFLPIVVASSFVSKENFTLLEDLKINDSKKMTDEKIRSCAPILIEKLPHSIVIITNKEYNNYKNNDINMNKVKALSHNKVLLDLKSSGVKYEKIIVDQFCVPGVYYHYLKDIQPKVTNITFSTKAESKNLSVAAASVIARYTFLLENDKLNKEYGITIPKGAGITVDNVGVELVSKYGEKVLEDLSKISFANTNKILNKIKK